MRIIDLTHYVAGPFATMLLAELGHDVIKVERPAGGDPWRQQSPEPAGAGFDFLNRRKRSITLDLKTRSGRTLLRRLLADADAVVENFRPGTLARLGISYRSLRRTNRNLVLTSISNFGQTGPRRDWKAGEITLQASGGIVAATGWREAGPLRLAGNIAQHIAGLNAAEATIAGVFGVHAGVERGVHIDISIQETFAAHWARHISQYVHHGLVMTRESEYLGRQGFRHTMMAADGWLYLLALRAEWAAFAAFLGLDEFATNEWSDDAQRQARWQEIDPHFRAAVAGRGRYDWFAAAAEMGYTFAPVEDPVSLLDNPQLAARGFFHPDAAAETSDGPTVPCPGLPFTGIDPPAAPNRPPRPGEHNAEIYGGLLGLGASELAELLQRGVI
ncbi:MAG: CaiB/BaiF CoA transferase family protein [Dehalococcoidia bacterium]